MQPFHLSFSTPDLDAMRSFYVDVLGCRVGRDTGKWMDILFFGHQITIHRASDRTPAVVLDHFGPILDKATWQTLVETCRSHAIEFELPPRVIGEATDSESGKFKIRDPAGNALEFKYYDDFDQTFGRVDEA